MIKDTDCMEQQRWYECRECGQIIILKQSRERCPRCNAGGGSKGHELVAKVFISKRHEVEVTRL